MKYETRNEDQKQLDLDNQAKAIRNVIRHADGAVDLVCLADELGLNPELKELLQGHPDWVTAVTKARMTAQLDGDLDDAVADQEAQRYG